MVTKQSGPGIFQPEEKDSNPARHGRKGPRDGVSGTEEGQGGWSRAQGSLEAQVRSVPFKELIPKAMLLHWVVAPQFCLAGS